VVAPAYSCNSTKSRSQLDFETGKPTDWFDASPRVRTPSQATELPEHGQGDRPDGEQPAPSTTAATRCAPGAASAAVSNSVWNATSSSSWPAARRCAVHAVPERQCAMAGRSRPGARRPRPAGRRSSPRRSNEARWSPPAPAPRSASRRAAPPVPGRYRHRHGSATSSSTAPGISDGLSRNNSHCAGCRCRQAHDRVGQKPGDGSRTARDRICTGVEQLRLGQPVVRVPGRDQRADQVRPPAPRACGRSARAGSPMSSAICARPRAWHAR